MFKIAQKKEVIWPVTVNVPVDGGKTQPRKIEVEYLVLSQEEQEAATGDLLAEIVKNVKGIVGEDNQPLEFNEETKKQLLNISYVRVALFAGFAEVLGGRAARKN